MRTHLIRRLAAAAAIAAGVGAVATAPVQADQQTRAAATTHYYSLHAKTGQGAITPHWVTSISAAMVEEYTTELRMQWSFGLHPGRNDVAIVNRQTGQCLEAEGGAPILAPCDGSLAQGWQLLYPPGPGHLDHTYVGLQNAQTQTALTVAAAGWAGTPLRLAPYAGVDAQRFDLVWRAAG